jgi:hypothetical protein
MKLVKVFVPLAAGAILIFVVVAESRYKCSGKVSSGGSSQPVTVYMKLEKYRWWVGLWSDSAGAVWLEIPNETVQYYEHTVEVGDQLQLFDSTKTPKGYFSTLSKTMAVSIPVSGFFDGTCELSY